VQALGALGEAALLHYGQEQPHIRQIEAQFFSFGLLALGSEISTALHAVLLGNVRRGAIRPEHAETCLPLRRFNLRWQGADCDARI
jgi:hypothetical protein